MFNPISAQTNMWSVIGPTKRSFVLPHLCLDASDAMENAIGCFNDDFILADWKEDEDEGVEMEKSSKDSDQQEETAEYTQLGDTFEWFIPLTQQLEEKSLMSPYKGNTINVGPLSEEANLEKLSVAAINKALLC